MKPSSILLLLTVLSAQAALFQSHAQDSPAPVRVDASDYPSLQAACDALPEAGGMVVLPPGTFELSKPLVISTPETHLSGSGASTHLKNVNESGEPALVLQPKNRQEDPKARLWRVSLQNFRVSGNEKSGDGIHAEGIQEIFLQGVSVDHHGGHGIALIDCYEDPRISDSIITYNKKAGLYIQANHDIVVNGNQFEENQDAVVCVDSFNLCMNGNNLDDHLGNGVVIENTYGSVVSGNMIEECQGQAIILDRDCYGITLSANVIAHEFSGGIDLRDAWGCAVSANTFTIVHQHGIRVGPNSGRITISANNFSNSHIGNAEKRDLSMENTARMDAGNGVVLDGAKHVAISGNVFSGMDGKAVSAANGCEGICVTGNVVTDVHRRDEDKSAPAIDLGDATQSLVENNLTP